MSKLPRTRISVLVLLGLVLFPILSVSPVWADRGDCTNAIGEALQNLQLKLPEDEFDRRLAEAAATGHLDLSAAPGKFYTLKSASLDGKSRGVLAGRAIHYVNLAPTAGAASKGTFILLGGLRYHAAQWNEAGFVDELRAAGYRVLVIDPPGQGWTLLRHAFEDGSTPGNLKIPSRYEKEDQAGAIYELLSQLKKQKQIDANAYLAGESYGGWLATYLATLKPFNGLFRDVFPLDPGIANTAHLLPGADQWSEARQQLLAFNPALAPLIPSRMPGADFYHAYLDTMDTVIADLKNHPWPAVRMQAAFLQSMKDIQLKALMDQFYPREFQGQSALRYAAAPALFNGIREHNAIAAAPLTAHPTHLIEAGRNSGIVPHLHHEDYAARNPNLRGWYRFSDAGHDLPVDAGKKLARFMVRIIEGEQPEKLGKRVDIR